MGMKYLFVLLVVFCILCPQMVLADTDPYEPFKNAKSVIMKGSSVSGETPYGTARVITEDGKCYKYLTDKGQFLKYKRCGDEEWKVINHNFITKK